MHIVNRLLIAIIPFAAFIAITGFLFLPPVLKHVLTTQISGVLHRETSINQIKINPFAFSASIKGFKLADPGQNTPFVAFDELYVNADVMTSVFKRALILEEIRLDKPYVGATRNADGSYNFSDLIPKAKIENEEQDKPLLFSLNNIQIMNGTIDFRDTPHNTDHTIQDLNVSLPFVSNIAYYMNNYVEPNISAIVNGHSVAIAGKTQPFLTSRATSFDIDMKDIDVPFYLQYVPMKMNFTLTEARLDTKLQLNFIMHQEKSPQLHLTGQAALKKKKVTVDDLQGNKILRLPALRVNIASVEPFIPRVHLDQIALDAPELMIQRDKQGNIDLLNLVGSNEKHEQTKATVTQDKQDDRAGKKKELGFLVDNFLIDKADITFIDFSPCSAGENSD